MVADMLSFDVRTWYVDQFHNSHGGVRFHPKRFAIHFTNQLCNCLFIW